MELKIKQLNTLLIYWLLYFINPQKYIIFWFWVCAERTEQSMKAQPL
jgi:hypothetical protein